MTQFKVVFATQSKKEHLEQYRKWKSIITQLIKIVVPENSKNYMSFIVWKACWSYYKAGLGNSLRYLGKPNNALKNKTKFLPVLDPKNVSNIILLRKIVFYQLKQCNIQQGWNQELQNLPFASSSPLTTKHSDRYMLTVAPIIDLFICFEACSHVTSKNINCNCHCSTVVTWKLTNDKVKVKVSPSRSSCLKGFRVDKGPEFSWRFGTTRVVGRQP